MCLGVVLFGSNFFGTLCASWTWMSISFTRLGMFSFIIISNKFSISYSSSPSGTPMIQMLVCLNLFQGFLTLSSFKKKNSCLFILFWLTVYLFLLFQIIDLNPSFLSFTVDSLYIFLYFTLYIAFTSSFILWLHSITFSEHTDYQCLELFFIW